MLELDVAKLRKAMTVKITCDDKGRDCKLIASITLKDPKTGRHKTFSREADLGEVIARIQDEISRTVGHGPGTHVSGWLSDSYHRARDISRRVVENKVVHALATDVLPEVAPYVPGLGAAVDIAHKAHEIVVMARQGSHEAHAKIAALGEMAREGHEHAAHTLNLMKHIATLLRQKEGYMTHGGGIAGWWYNKPFRDPITARNLDFSDPFNAARYLYGRGLTER